MRMADLAVASRSCMRGERAERVDGRGGMLVGVEGIAGLAAVTKSLFGAIGLAAWLPLAELRLVCRECGVESRPLDVVVVVVVIGVDCSVNGMPKSAVSGELEWEICSSS